MLACTRLTDQSLRDLPCLLAAKMQYLTSGPVHEQANDRPAQPPSLAEVRVSAARADERWPAGQARTVVMSGASTTGITAWSGHCQARLKAG